jgi:two-component system chemotaxis sensor kinase CheA
MNMSENDARRAELQAELDQLNAADAQAREAAAASPPPADPPAAAAPPPPPPAAPEAGAADTPADPVDQHGNAAPVAFQPSYEAPEAPAATENEVVAPFVPSYPDPADTAAPAGPSFSTLQEIEQHLRGIARAIGITL